MKSEQGFTLIEALVALVIAATAMMALMGRLGASADIQRTLNWQSLALEAASEQLATLALQPLQQDSLEGELQRGGYAMKWRSWVEKTMVSGFVRMNVSVTSAGEGKVALFLYRAVP